MKASSDIPGALQSLLSNSVSDVQVKALQWLETRCSRYVQSGTIRVASVCQGRIRVCVCVCVCLCVCVCVSYCRRQLLEQFSSGLRSLQALQSSWKPYFVGAEPSTVDAYLLAILGVVVESASILPDSPLLPLVPKELLDWFHLTHKRFYE